MVAKRHWLISAFVLCLPAIEALAQTAAAPDVSITIGGRQGRAIPTQGGFTHLGGGNIEVAQPSSDTLVVTVTGVAVAGAHPCKDSAADMACDVVQTFEVGFDKPSVKRAKLTLEGRVIGLLRSHAKGCGKAQLGCADATVSRADSGAASISMPHHAVSGGQSLSVNDLQGPVSAVVFAGGAYTLHQTFNVSAQHPQRLICYKASSSEFAPDPALDPLWISYYEPFHGAAKKDFGFQVTIKVSADNPTTADSPAALPTAPVKTSFADPGDIRNGGVRYVPISAEQANAARSIRNSGWKSANRQESGPSILRIPKFPNGASD